jgi:hypothetical protein
MLATVAFQSELPMQARKLAPSPAKAFHFSLHIRHPSMDPREISRELSCEAEESFAAGAPRSSGSGVAAAAVHSETYWGAPVEIDFSSVGPFSEAQETRLGGKRGDPVDTNVTMQLWGLVLRHAKFLRRIRTEGGSASVIATVLEPSQRTFRFTPELSRALGELGITLEIEFAG